MFVIAVVLSIVVLLVFGVLIAVHKQRDWPAINIWLSSGVVGVLLGAVSAHAIVSAMGNNMDQPKVKADDAEGQAHGNPNQSGGKKSGGKKGGGGMGGKGGGRSGGRGGRERENRSLRALTSFIRKLDVLTGDVRIQLSKDQKTKVAKILNELNGKEDLKEEAAKAALEDLKKTLTKEQNSKQDSVALPRRSGERGGRGGSNSDANPFKSDENGKALKSLMKNVGS